MMNRKGFTLTEVLLAALIVGVMGVALAALTTSAVRESSTGRTKAVLRNQISIALRQLRQDIQESVSVKSIQNGIELTKKTGDEYKLGPDTTAESSVRYTYQNHKMTRTVEGVPSDWLTNVRHVTVSGTTYPNWQIIQSNSNGVSSVLRLRMVVGIDSEPPVNEYIDETFILPQGF